MRDPVGESGDATRRDRWSREVRARLATLRLSAAREADIVDELAEHLEDRYRDAIAAGATSSAAVEAALADLPSGDALARRLAPLAQSRVAATPTLGAATGHLLRDLLQDLRHAARMFRKQRAFAATAVLTLALGIGATTAIFSVVYGVLLKPLPFEEPDALVTVRQHAPHGVGTNQGPATYLTYRENQQTFESLGIWDDTDVSVETGGVPERVRALLVTASALDALRVRPHLGQAFGPADDEPGHPLRVMLSHSYWQRRFGGEPSAIGRVVSIDGRPAEVVGVLPASFAFLDLRPDVLLPLALDASAPRGISFGFQALARLKSGVTLDQANADVARMISLLPPDFAKLELGPDVRPLADEAIGNVGRILWTLLTAVGAVLLIACANVANLFVVQAEARRQELATRVALGASKLRIARAFLSESVLLALAGGVLGLVFAQAGIVLLRSIALAELPRLDEIALTPAVLLFALGVSLASGALFGSFAALKFGAPSVDELNARTRSGAGTPGRHRVRDALVVGQFALALPLLIVSGLMIRTFVAMQDVDPGFTRPDEVQTFVVAIPPGLIGDPLEAARAFEDVAERLSRIPGVASVGLSSSVTMDGEDNGNPIEVEGRPAPDDGSAPLRRFKAFGPGYLETMGNRLVAGRSIEWSDVRERRPVVVVSAALAREYWNDPSEALGKRVRSFLPGAPWREIVGVAGDERDDGLDRPPTPIVYWPMLSESYRWRIMTYVVRSSRVGAPGFFSEIETAVRSVNRSLPLAMPRTLEEIRALSMARTSFALAMLSIAAGIALVIGVVGLYGVIAYLAAQRTREIGIRMALGARTGHVRTLFVRHGLVLAAVGIAVGIAAAVAVTRVMAAFLFGVTPFDPTTYAVMSAALAAAALLATYLPARRASRVDPVVALRGDA